MSKISCPLSQHASDKPDEIALIQGPMHLTYRHLNNCVSSTATQLLKQGVSTHDRVGVILFKSPELVILLHALWRIGANAIILNNRVPTEVTTRHLLAAGCQFVIESITFKLEDESSGLIPLDIEDLVSLDAAEKDSDLFQLEIDSQFEATGLMTSGTSAAPRLAIHTYHAHYFNALGSNTRIALKPSDRWILSLPLFHVSGVSILFRCLLAGSAVVIPPFQGDLERSLHRYKITHVSMVPTQLIRIFRDQSKIDTLRQLTAILLGGGPMSDDLINEIRKERLPVYITYGLTETASQLATSYCLDNPQESPVGCVLPHREFRLNPEGEIEARGEVLFKGYWENGSLSSPFTDGGWFATGDLGRLNQDGRLAILGRKDNMFISGGENIHPEEIERCLEAMPEIEQAMVVPLKDNEFGSRPAAFVKLIPSDPIKGEDILLNLTQHLPKFKIPVKVYSWPEQLRPTAIKVPRQLFVNLLNEQPDSLKDLI